MPDAASVPVEKRKLTSHIVNGLNERITIEVMDEPGSGNAHHEYQLTVEKSDGSRSYCYVKFQKGPIQEVGFNGFSNEALLAVLIDRMECFQSGPFACNENAAALANLLAAMENLQSRTKARMARGVEGTLQK